MKEAERYVLGLTLRGIFAGMVLLSALMLLAVLVMPGQQLHAQGYLKGRPWTCSVDAVGTAVKECLPALGSANLSSQDQDRLYVTDIVATSTTATGGEMVLQYGTGADCVTTAVNFFPASGTAGVVRYGYSGNAVAPVPISFQTPLAIPATKRVCVIGIATQLLTIQINGYLAP